MLLDLVMSFLNTKRACVMDTFVATLQNHLHALMQLWSYLGFSFTPKMHVLLNHSVDRLTKTGGFGDMGEDR